MEYRNVSCTNEDYTFVKPISFLFFKQLFVILNIKYFPNIYKVSQNFSIFCTIELLSRKRDRYHRERYQIQEIPRTIAIIRFV